LIKKGTELELNNYNLNSKHKAAYVKDKADAVWLALRRAHALLPEMLDKEKFDISFVLMNPGDSEMENYLKKNNINLNK
jgi:hypothetical protein